VQVVSWRRAAGTALAVVVVSSLLPPGSATAGPGVGSRAVVAAATPAASSPAARFVPAGPTRLFDTRSGGLVPAGKVAPHGSLTVTVAGAAGVPATGVTAVVLNVTMTESTNPSFVQVLPTGQATVGAYSNINVSQPNQTIAGQVTAPLGDNGQLTFYSDGGGHLIADVLGYYTQATTATAGRFAALAPSRVLDTRSGLGVPPPPNPGDTVNCSDFGGWSKANAYFWEYYRYYGDVAKLDGDNNLIPCQSLPGAPSSPQPIAQSTRPANDSSMPLQVTGAGGVPTSGVSSVALNLTAVNPAENAFVQAVPSGGSATLGSTSNLNVGAGATVANLVTVPVGADGTITLFTSRSADLLADVVGYYTDSTAADSSVGLFHSVAPARQLDTRSTGQIPARGQQAVPALGRSGIPATGVGAVVVNAVVANNLDLGFLQVLPTGGTTGQSSTVNMNPDGSAVANSSLTPLTNGSYSIYVASRADAIVDVFGYFQDGSAATTAPGGSAAATELAVLTVAPNNTTVAYDRSTWVHWVDADHDCQDTRAEVLIRDTQAPVTPAGGCTVSTGSWLDPYTGNTLTQASDVDIDHRVPLGNAHVSGGYAWSAAQKQAYANYLDDPAQLVAVTDTVNQSKGDRSPDQWKPPLTSDYCDYATNWIEVKDRWALTITQPEHDALATMLTTC
jgi:hypothetical protein